MNAIDFERVTLTRDGRMIVSDFSATIRSGEFIGVIGPNGAGKTTLLQAVLGLLRPSSGEIRVFGRVPSRGDRDAGYLPQRRSTVGELELSGRDFVASASNGVRLGLPLLGKATREADWAIEAVEATPYARRPLCELSGGELQRLHLAQALLGRPRLLLLDETLISLDPRIQHAVVELVQRLQRTLGMTVLFTAHEFNPLLSGMDRVLYLGHERGAIGTVDEVMTTPVLSALYGTPIDVLRLYGRIVIIARQGVVDAEVHRRHV